MLRSYNLRPDGEPDPFSMHGGCPPADGSTAWKVNKWIWNRPCTFITHIYLLSRALTLRCTDAEANARMDKSGNVHGVARDLSHGPGTTAHG